jgi:hypothetical protein
VPYYSTRTGELKGTRKEWSIVHHLDNPTKSPIEAPEYDEEFEGLKAYYRGYNNDGSNLILGDKIAMVELRHGKPEAKIEEIPYKSPEILAFERKYDMKAAVYLIISAYG